MIGLPGSVHMAVGIPGLRQVAMVCLGHIAVKREVDWGQDE